MVIEITDLDHQTIAQLQYLLCFCGMSCEEGGCSLSATSLLFIGKADQALSLKVTHCSPSRLWFWWSWQAKYFITFHTIGPNLPFPYLKDSVMAESPDGEGVLIFGGQTGNMPDKIMELRAGTNSWVILMKKLKNPQFQHTVIPIPWYNYFIKLHLKTKVNFINKNKSICSLPTYYEKLSLKIIFISLLLIILVCKNSVKFFW